MIHAGIDLHANNMVIIAINDNGDMVREQKLSTSLTLRQLLHIRGRQAPKGVWRPVGDPSLINESGRQL